MKRLIAFALILSTILLGICSCSASKRIKYIKVDSSEYCTVYLYSFKDAKIDSKYSSLVSSEEPTESGYVFSTEKLEKGDTVWVWEHFHFDDLYGSYTNIKGTTAIVDDVLKTYYVKAESKNDTYLLTYYNMSSGYLYRTATNRSQLEDRLEEIKAEVTKDRVTIYYFTD